MPNSAKPKPAEHSQLSPPGSIALDEDGVDVYLSHCFHQGKKKSIKLAAFSLMQAGVRTGKSELDLRLQKHNHCYLGWTQELTPLQSGHRRHILQPGGGTA